MDVWFDYPLHSVDQSGQLASCKPDTGAWTPEEMQDKKQKEKDLRVESAVAAYNTARSSYEYGKVPLKVICEVVGVGPKTAAGYFRSLDGYVVSDGINDTAEKCTATVARLEK